MKTLMVLLDWLLSIYVLTMYPFAQYQSDPYTLHKIDPIIMCNCFIKHGYDTSNSKYTHHSFVWSQSEVDAMTPSAYAAYYVGCRVVGGWGWSANLEVSTST